MNWSELKLSTNELGHNSHRLIPKDSHINNFIHCYFLFKVSECPVRHKANSLDLPYKERKDGLRSSTNVVVDYGMSLSSVFLVCV